MENGNLYPITRRQEIPVETSSLRLGHDSSYTEWRVAAPKYDRQPGKQQYLMRGGLTCVARIHESRDDVLVPPCIRNTTTIRGLSEVTNLEHLLENASGRWRNGSHSNSYFPQNLQVSGYADRFRSSNVSAVGPSCTLTRTDRHGPSYWRNRQEMAQWQETSRQKLACKSRKTPHIQADYSERPPPLLQSQRYQNQNVSYVTFRPTSSSFLAPLIHAPTPPGVVNRNSFRESSDVLEGKLSTFAVVSLRKRCYEMEPLDYAEKQEEQGGDKRSKNGMLDVLCSATLELGPIQANPTTGCSCPRSHCIKLYCDCFKAGRPCSELCSCLNCKNTEEETKIDGERIRAIKNTLARNPRAFNGGKKEAVPQNPGDVVCNCLKSKCLKLYCQCFQAGRICNEACLCISCLNTSSENVVGGRRNLAIQNCLEKRPDAFTKKPKAVGDGCACKNNRCLKKYCDCFRFNLSCSDKCTCRDCGNGKGAYV